MNKKIARIWRDLRLKPHKLFLILGLSFGFAFVFLIPPFQSPDEHYHFFRAYQVHQGVLVGERVEPIGSGGMLPGNMDNIVFDLLNHNFPGEELNPYNINKIKKYFSIKPDNTFTELVQFPNTVVYTPVNYIVSSGVLLFTNKLLNLSMIQSFYIIRIAGLLVWVLSMYFIIKLIPLGKWALFVIALLPASLAEAATINADLFTNITVILFIALVVYLYKKRTILKNVDIVLLFIILMLIALAKPGYLIVSPIIFVLINKFKEKKILISFLKLSLLILIPILIFSAWTYLMRHFSSQIPLFFRPGLTVDPISQIHNIITNPSTVVIAYLNNFLTNTSSLTFTGLIGIFGWSDTIIPEWSIFLAYLLLIFSLVYVTKKEQTEIIQNKKVKLLFFSTFIISIFAIMALLYLTWNPVGALRIEGLQGRYFIPLLPLLIVPLQYSGIQIKRGENFRAMILTCGMFFILVISTLFLIIRFWTNV